MPDFRPDFTLCFAHQANPKIRVNDSNPRRGGHAEIKVDRLDVLFREKEVIIYIEEAII